jgi:cyclohexadienyl dehydratase
VHPHCFASRARGTWRAVALAVALAAVAGCGASCTPRDVDRRAAPVLRVGTSGDYPPFSVRSRDGEWSGFDVEVARAYARDRGSPLELVPFRWPELDAALARGDFDVAMSGVTVRADRLADGDFTASVAATDAVLVAPRGVTAPRRVVVNRGGHLERVARTTLPGLELVPVDDNRRLLLLVAEGAADGAVTDRLELASTGGDELAVVAVLSSDRKAYWTTPANAALARDLDAWLAEREADGTLPALRARHLGDAQQSGLPPPVGRLIDLLGRRLMLMPLVAEAKRAAGLPIDDPARERAVEARAASTAATLCLEPRAYVALVRAEVEAAKAVQRATLAAAPATPLRSLDALRAAIDRVDAALGRALAAAVPIGSSPAALDAALRRAAPPAVDPTVLAPLVAALRALAQAPCLPPSQQVSMIERQRRQTSLPRSSITGPSHTGHASRHAPASAVVPMHRS